LHSHRALAQIRIGEKFMIDISIQLPNSKDVIIIKLDFQYYLL